MVWIDVQRNLWQRVSVAALGLHAVFSFKQIKGERKRQGKYQANGYRFGYCYCADNLTRFSVVQHTINSKYTLLTVGRKQKSCSGKVEMMQLFSLFTSSPWALKHFLRTLDDTSQATFLLLEVKKQNRSITNFVTGVFAFFFILFFFQQACVHTKNLTSNIDRFRGATDSILSVHQKSIIWNSNYATRKLSLQYECKYCFSSYQGDFFFFLISTMDFIYG